MTRIAELGRTVNTPDLDWLLVIIVITVVITCIYMIYRCISVKHGR